MNIRYCSLKILSKFQMLLEELLNQSEACLSLFEWIFHGISKYSIEFQDCF